jgi:hypothetical protein
MGAGQLTLINRDAGTVTVTERWGRTGIGSIPFGVTMRRSGMYVVDDDTSSAGGLP